MNSFELEIIGYIAGFCTTICLLPQLWKIMKTRSAEDVILTFIVLFCGQALWITYGILLNDLRLIIPNVISCTLTLSIIIGTYIFIVDIYLVSYRKE